MFAGSGAKRICGVARARAGVSTDLLRAAGAAGLSGCQGRNAEQRAQQEGERKNEIVWVLHVASTVISGDVTRTR